MKIVANMDVAGTSRAKPHRISGNQGHEGIARYKFVPIEASRTSLTLLNVPPTENNYLYD